MARAYRRFRTYNRNDDGKLVQAEIPKRNVRKAMKRFDRNGDGAIDKAEWRTRVLAEFNKHDQDQDGALLPEEQGTRYSAGPVEATNDDGDEE